MAAPDRRHSARRGQSRTQQVVLSAKSAPSPSGDAGALLLLQVMAMVGGKAIKLDGKGMQAEAMLAVDRAMDASAKLGRQRLQVRVASWKTKVKFITTGTGPEREISTTNDIYRYNDDGTAPHIIRPRYARRLRFVPRGQRGFVYARQVNHPGTKAQNMSEKVAQQLEQNDMPRIFEREFARI
jgi:hypothetical protein